MARIVACVESLTRDIFVTIMNKKIQTLYNEHKVELIRRSEHILK